MDCLDCRPDEVVAVAICGHCGAGVCVEHLIESDEQLTVRMPINRPVPIDPPARKLRCGRCMAAEEARRKSTAV